MKDTVKRADAIRLHSEQAAAYTNAAASATGPARTHLQGLAVEHQEFADMARHHEYPEELEN